jgi:molybdate transport system ATP-binding protein
MIAVRVKKKLLTADGPIGLDVDIKISGQEIVTLFGPSGSGKTSILRMIAGLTDPDEGYIAINDEVWFDSRNRINKPVQQRQISFVSQNQNLFPHMTVAENLRYALKDKGQEYLIVEFLEMVDLTALKDQRPHLLSTGQRQRVALIRALLRKSKIFLLDEPLSSLDVPLRLKLQDDILALHRKFEVPTIFVTHDLSETFKLSQQILFLEQGKVTKSGKPSDIFGDGLSGKFKFVGSILELVREGFLFIVTIQIGQNLTKVVATEDEIKGMNIGDRVIVSAKAFNPIILKI